MTTYKLLSIDESGKPSYNHQSKLFVLSGIITPEKLKPKFDRLTRKLKKKYFKDEEIVFHSRDMYRRKGPFSILQEPKKEMEFWTEFISILNDSEIGMMFIIADKQKAKHKGWQEQTILKRSYQNILQKQNKMSKIELMKKELIERKLGNTANPSVFEVLI